MFTLPGKYYVVVLTERRTRVTRLMMQDKFQVKATTGKYKDIIYACVARPQLVALSHVAASEHRERTK